MSIPKLFNGFFSRVPDKTDMERELADRLLWLRNHYDVGDAALKPKVLAEIDATLARFDPSLRLPP